jgi:hypothetical protein
MAQNLPLIQNAALRLINVGYRLDPSGFTSLQPGVKGLYFRSAGCGFGLFATPFLLDSAVVFPLTTRFRPLII